MSTRILTISKAYVCAPYRKKLALLAEDPRFEVGVICPELWGNQRFEEPTSVETSKIWLRSLPTFFSNKNHFHVYRNLRRAVDEFAPDIMNIEEEDYSMVTWQCFRLAKELGAVPTFYAWQNIFKNYPPPFKNVEQYIYRNAAGAMCGSDEAGEVLQRKGYKGKYFTIPQVGIDMTNLTIQGDVKQEKANYKRKIGVDPDKYTIFFAGRVVYEKGVQTLIDACANLKDSPIQLVVVGSGPYQIDLKKQAARVLPDGVAHFVDYVSASKVHEYIKAADLMCLCSLTRRNWREQGPVRIITESMSAQANVIVSNSGPLPKVVDDCGLVFDEGDSTMLTEKIESLLCNEALSDDLRARGVLRVREHFSAEAVALKCADYFEGLT